MPTVDLTPKYGGCEVFTPDQHRDLVDAFDRIRGVPSPAVQQPAYLTTPPLLPTTVAGWTLCGHCPRCGKPMWARPNEEHEPPLVRKSCECYLGQR